MKKSFDIWKWLVPVGLLASSCIHEELVYDSSVGDTSSDPYVKIRIAVPSESTRSNPVGGEEGNGREQGVLNEEKIHNLNVFFYNNNAGLDAPDDCVLFNSIYYNLDNPSDEANSEVSLEWKEESQDVYGLNQRYLELTFKSGSTAVADLAEGIRFAVVANTGKIASNTLGALRNITLEKAASSLDPTVADNFVMSTAFNQEYTYGGVSTGTNYFRKSGEALVGSTTVERLVGRIDLWYNAAENAGIATDAAAGVEVDRLVYKADDSENKVFITNVLPVNVMQSPSYLFKKVTNLGPQTPTFWTVQNLSQVSDFSWGGKETPSDPTPGADMPTNYVIERTTGQKIVGGNSTLSSLWFGNTSASSVIRSIADASYGKVSDYYNEQRIKGLFDPDYNCDRISIISYANENTHPIDCFHSDYLTGLAFRGFYLPEKIYSSFDPVTDVLTELSERNVVPAEGKIFRYSPSGTTGVKDPSEKFTLYFSNENAANAYKNAHASENGILTAFTAELNAELGLGFACYYNLWLRHFNDESADPGGNYPMEYATVRNNIYRVSISFTGPGDPTPTMREPDTMHARIFVRKWNLRTENQPLEF